MAESSTLLASDTWLVVWKDVLSCILKETAGDFTLLGLMAEIVQKKLHCNKRLMLQTGKMLSYIRCRKSKQVVRVKFG